jgi:acetyl-CoA C-acetyltransferase
VPEADVVLFGGALRDVPSVDLAAFTMRAAIDRAGITPEDVDEVYHGVTIPSEEALDGSIPARVAMLRAGIPDDRLSLTLDRACCSSMTAVHLATRAIRSGDAQVVLAGGADNMGRAAFLLPPSIRWGIKRGGPTFKDAMAEPGADIGGKPVAVDAGEVAAEHGITRLDADRFALRSHRDYFRAKREGFFNDEILPYAGDAGALDADEGPREDTSEEKLARLRTVFGGPIVTPGNAPGQDAGSCFLVLTSRRFAEERGIEPLAQVHGAGSVARTPREIAVAPAPAVRKALARRHRPDRNQRGVRLRAADVRPGAGERQSRTRALDSRAAQRERRGGGDRPSTGSVRRADPAHAGARAAPPRRRPRRRGDLRRARPSRCGRDRRVTVKTRHSYPQAGARGA